MATHTMGETSGCVLKGVPLFGLLCRHCQHPVSIPLGNHATAQHDHGAVHVCTHSTLQMHPPCHTKWHMSSSDAMQLSANDWLVMAHVRHVGVRLCKCVPK